MGTLAALAPVLGLLAGIIIAKLTTYELKQGQKYFKLLQYALLLAVVSTAVWQHVNGQPINVSTLIFLIFIPVGTLHHKKYWLLTGIAAAYILITAILTV